MHIKLDNRIIATPIETILYKIRRECKTGKLRDIDVKNERNINVTCPCHKEGRENRPSCQVLNDPYDEKLEAGVVHCFTCGFHGPFYKLVAAAFNKSDEWAQKWLIDNFGDTIIQQQTYLPPFEKVKLEKNYLDESILKDYDFYHPYMWQRNLSKEVVDQFRVGYDQIRKAITFPVYDEKGKLVMVTARSVNSKRFYIPPEVDKPVYLLYDILQRHVTKVFVCESQINTLTLRTWGFDSIGLFGTGSYKQLKTLKTSGIRNYILCFDGDEAGRKGAQRFKENIGNDVFVTDIIFPPGTDVNDMTKEEFLQLLNRS